MVRVITQETFDGVVKENIEEFGLDKEEAIKEAIAQFESQVKNEKHSFFNGYFYSIVTPHSYDLFIQITKI